MALTDFLFNGSPPPSVTTYSSSTANLPVWYSDYTEALLGKANAVAAEPYQAYGGPRIADFNGDQQNAFAATRNNMGAYQPALDAAAGTAFDAAHANPLNAAQPALDAASEHSYDSVDSYMNPYNDAVTNRIGDLAARNLNEKLMPAIGDEFTRAGQFGGSRMQEMTGRALRDTQESALAAQSSALQSGYAGAQSAVNADLSRFGQIGQVAGNLASANQANMVSAGNSLGTLAQAGQTMGLKDNAALEAVGQTQQAMDQNNLNTAYSDFRDQVQYPQNQIGFLSNTIRGIAAPVSTSGTDTRPAAAYSASPLSTLASGLGGIASLLKAKGGRVKSTSPRRGALQLAGE